MDLVRVENENGADGFLTARYKARDEFFNQRDTHTWMYYSIVGTKMFFGGTPDPLDGTRYRIAYYGEVPALSDTQHELDLHEIPGALSQRPLMHAALHAVGEEQTAATLSRSPRT